MKKSIISIHNTDNLQNQRDGVIEIIPSVQSKPIYLSSGNRQELIKILRQIPGFLDVAKKLAEGKTYQAYFPPEVRERLRSGLSTLDEKDNGLFGALVRDVETGQITNQVSLMEVVPDLISSLSQMATQQTLTDIVNRLEVIDEKITDILNGQINDRLAEVESGIHTYEQALAASDPKSRLGLLLTAIQNLNDGRNKLIKAIDFSFLDELPQSRVGMFFNFHGDIPKYVQSKSKPIWECTHAIIKASRYLVLAYSTLNEPDSLRVSLEQVECQVKSIQVKTREVVSWLEPESNLRESLLAISQGVLPSVHDLIAIPQSTIVVEFQPNEIAPLKEYDYESLQG